MSTMHRQSGQFIASEPDETVTFSNQTRGVNICQIYVQLQLEVAVCMANIAKPAGNTLQTQVTEQTTCNLIRG